jgi:hypothetical protein
VSDLNGWDADEMAVYVAVGAVGMGAASELWRITL